MIQRRGEKNMWIVVYLAQSMAIATEVERILSEGSLLVKLRAVEGSLDAPEGYVEVTVPENESEQAHRLIIESGL